MSRYGRPTVGPWRPGASGRPVGRLVLEAVAPELTYSFPLPVCDDGRGTVQEKAHVSQHLKYNMNTVSDLFLTVADLGCREASTNWGGGGG